MSAKAEYYSWKIRMMFKHPNTNITRTFNELITIMNYPRKPYVKLKEYKGYVQEQLKENHEEIQKQLGMEFDLV